MIIAIIYILAACFALMYVYISFKHRKQRKQWMQMYLEHQRKLEEFNKKVNINIED